MHKITTDRGFSVIEILLAAALFLIFSSGAVGIIIYGNRMNLLGEEQAVATQFANEGVEAVRSIKNQNFTTLSNTYCATGSGIQKSGSVWTLKATGTSDTFDTIYNRIITICDVQRNSNGDIVASGGTNDPYLKKVTSTVSWNAGTTRADSVVLSTYYTNWKKKKGGMLVYGNGGTTTNAIAYKLWDGATGNWGTAGSVNGGIPTGALRTTRLYSSPTRDEKILVSRHLSGTTQTIYAQVWNGSAWGSFQQLSTWSAGTFLDVRNFDGTYLANGDFMVIYSDNTSIPKMRTWNGTTWSAQVSMQDFAINGSGIPNYIVVSARASTNEVMAAFYGQAKDTNTQYFNGGTYTTANWTLHARHASAATVNTNQMVDFAWSPNTTTKGALVYTDSNNDKSVNIKIWTANGSGSGAWTATVNTANQTSNVGALQITGRPGADEFVVCDKDANASPRIICYESNMTPVWTNPTNPTLVTGSDTGIERSYDIGFEQIGGTQAIAVYSDNTGVPKLKKYNAGTNTWDLAATSIATSPFTPGVIKAVRIEPRSEEDMMILTMDANLDVYSSVWDITNDVIYTTPAGKAFSQHGTNGSAITEFWADFEWDRI
jgi:type II secretory pathway pseudopilin PulG